MAVKEAIEITCRVNSIQYSKASQYSEGKHWCVISTSEGKITGEVELASILTGCEYRVGGWWEENNFGRSFKFKSIAIKEPVTRSGVSSYLGKYVPYIGAATAMKLCDRYGVDKCISVLRDTPEVIANDNSIPGMNMERCLNASAILKGLSKFEDTRIALLDMFTGRKFRQNLPDLCIAKWGVSAAATIKANAFVLIDEKFPGCGFMLVDELYLALGGDIGDMRRQTYALCYVLQNLQDNSTWGSRSFVLTELGKICSRGLNYPEAINQCINQNKIKARVEKGEMFLAAKNLADQEIEIAERLWHIAGDSLLDPSVESPEAPRSRNPLDDLFDISDPREEVAVVPEEFNQKHQDMSFADVVDDDLSIELDSTGKDGAENYETAQELYVVLDELLEKIQDYEPARDYFESVQTRAASISETIEKNKTATKNQIAAFTNMIEGCEKWAAGMDKERDQ
jgi:hypothetical protein